MTPDPFAYIIFATLLGGCIGFFGCALIVSRQIRRIETKSFEDGYACCNRDHSNRPKI